MRVLAPLLLLLALAPPLQADEITAKEAEEFGRALQKSLREGDLDAFAGRFDNRALVEGAVARVDAKPEDKAAFVRGALKSLDFGRQIAGAIQEEGSYTFLRVRSDPLRVRFRLILPDSSLNYHDLTLARDASGRVRAADVYVFVLGEALSVTLRRAFRSGMKHNRGFLREAEKFKRAQALHAEQQHREAYELLNTLAGDWPKTPSVLALKIMVAVELDEETLVKATEDFEAALPDSPALHLVLIDKLIVQKKWKEVFAHIEALDGLVGGDAFLKVMRANCYTLQGKLPQAKAQLVKATQQEPTLLDAHYSLIDVALALEEWQLVSDQLTLVEREFAIEWGDLTQFEGFVPYTRTKEFQRWLRRHEDSSRRSPANSPPGDVPEGR